MLHEKRHLIIQRATLCGPFVSRLFVQNPFSKNVQIFTRLGTQVSFRLVSQIKLDFSVNGYRSFKDALSINLMEVTSQHEQMHKDKIFKMYTMTRSYAFQLYKYLNHLEHIMHIRKVINYLA